MPVSIFNIEVHGHLRLLWAYKERIGCTPSPGARAEMQLTSVFSRFLKGCRGRALGCQHQFPFFVWYFWPGLCIGHIYLSHSHPIAIYACPIPWDVSQVIPIVIPFPWTSLLSTHFHKNSSFRPNMLNCLNATFTFGKSLTLLEPPGFGDFGKKKQQVSVALPTPLLLRPLR